MRQPSYLPDLTSPAARRDLLAAGVLIAFGLWIVRLGLKIPLGVATDPLGPRFFPVALGAGIAICGLLLAAGVLFFRGMTWRVTIPGEGGPDDDETAGGGAFSPARLVGAIVATAAYLAAFDRIGYLLSTPAYVLAVMVLHGGAPPRNLVIAPAVVTVVLYAVFKFGLLIPVPDGVLAPLLGR